MALDTKQSCVDEAVKAYANADAKVQAAQWAIMALVPILQAEVTLKMVEPLQAKRMINHLQSSYGFVAAAGEFVCVSHTEAIAIAKASDIVMG